MYGSRDPHARASVAADSSRDFSVSKSPDCIARHPRSRPYLSAEGAAAILSIQPASVRARIRRGGLEARRFGGRWRVLRRSVAEVLERSPRWKQAAVGGRLVAAYVTPSGSVVALWRFGPKYRILQRFPDGTFERFEPLDPERVSLHYEYALCAGVTTGPLAKGGARHA